MNTKFHGKGPQYFAHDPGDVTRESIRARAYEIYRSRSAASGNALSDWLQAERELQDELCAIRCDAQGLCPIDREPPLVEVPFDLARGPLLKR